MQEKHAFEELLGEKDPAQHDWQGTLGLLVKVPAEHTMQAEAFASAAYEPASQDAHDVARLELEKVPAGQPVHAVAAGVERNEPRLQSKHAVAAVRCV